MSIVLQANGKYKQKGKEYVVEDGDIIFFKFNAGAGLTGKKEKKIVECNLVLFLLKLTELMEFIMCLIVLCNRYEIML